MKDIPRISDYMSKSRGYEMVIGVRTGTVNRTCSSMGRDPMLRDILSRSEASLVRFQQ